MIAHPVKRDGIDDIRISKSSDGHQYTLSLSRAGSGIVSWSSIADAHIGAVIDALRHPDKIVICVHSYVSKSEFVYTSVLQRVYRDDYPYTGRIPKGLTEMVADILEKASKQ